MPQKLVRMKTNDDFLKHWSSSVHVAHPSETPATFIGEEEHVNYPAIFLISTHGKTAAVDVMEENDRHLKTFREKEIQSLDVKVTPMERIEVARRIPAEWRRIGRILGPEPTFKEYDLDECEQGRQGRDCAQEMLRKWAEKYDNEATRRHLIDAMIKEGLKARASEVFQMS